MEPFEYVVVLTSLILGLAIAQILNGVSDLISHWKRVKFNPAHSIYVLVIFLICIQEWWVNYQYSKIISVWTLPVVLTILVFPIVLFLQVRMLFPTGSRAGETDMDVYFKDQWKWLYAMGAMTVLISIWHNITLSNLSLLEQIPLIAYLVVYLEFIYLNVKSQKAHTIFATLQLIAQIAFIVLVEDVL